MCDNRRRVAETVIGDARISTVFLGLDHGWGGRLLLFETMIFGGEHDGFQERSTTWEEAEKDHAIACAPVGEGQPPDEPLRVINSPL